MATNETQYARRGRETATTFLSITDDVLAWRNTYWDRAYNSGGENEITNEDVAEVGVTAADVTGMISFADALETFLVANRAYLSKMRQDM